MKKTMFLMVFFLLFGSYLFSQTWTERNDDFDMELRVITREEWNRLLRQREVQYTYAILMFVDVLEGRGGNTIIRGTRPTFQGYYYLLSTWTPRTDSARLVLNLSTNTFLMYGNNRTGIFTIGFTSQYNVDFFRVGSDSYNRRYNQYINWVNGEQ